MCSPLSVCLHSRLCLHFVVVTGVLEVIPLAVVVFAAVVVTVVVAVVFPPVVIVVTLEESVVVVTEEVIVVDVFINSDVVIAIAVVLAPAIKMLYFGEKVGD